MYLIKPIRVTYSERIKPKIIIYGQICVVQIFAKKTHASIALKIIELFLNKALVGVTGCCAHEYVTKKHASGGNLIKSTFKY